MALKPAFIIQRDQAFSRLELMVVVAIVLFLAMIVSAMLAGGKRRELRIQCADNLKQINDAFRNWESLHTNAFPVFPALVSVTNGGTMELNNGSNAWINFEVLKDLLNTPKIFHCPADAGRTAATDYNSLQGKVSYFINLNANILSPEMPLDGDNNIATNGIPAMSGLLNLSPETQITWTTTRHKRVGNIGFADGSVLDISDSALKKVIEQTGPTSNGPISEWEVIQEHKDIPTNRIAIP